MYSTHCIFYIVYRGAGHTGIVRDKEVRLSLVSIQVDLAHRHEVQEPQANPLHIPAVIVYIVCYSALERV